ncbi:helix-turn-helix transcriptional regulator [Paenibacillus tritici]|uniref:Helix-turn-helix transcriptional regulator n=1 Tax=Paenibacillus tritici TaxID=1873425 RepID=A0ABX2DQY2_9BACL|nr:helix-turn-helix transcriptional regulator [Paenibacillus tritici]
MWSGASLDGGVRQFGLSNSRLSHLFKENTGISLSGYMVLHKLQKATYLIFEGLSITDAAMAAGFDSPSHECILEGN